jgi:hypothetical protein
MRVADMPATDHRLSLPDKGACGKDGQAAVMGSSCIPKAVPIGQRVECITSG